MILVNKPCRREAVQNSVSAGFEPICAASIVNDRRGERLTLALHKSDAPSGAHSLVMTEAVWTAMIAGAAAVIRAALWYDGCKRRNRNVAGPGRVVGLHNARSISLSSAEISGLAHAVLPAWVPDLRTGFSMGLPGDSATEPRQS